MYNQRLDQLTDYPFQRLRTLLQDVAPPADVEPIALHIGEPRHPPPAFISSILAEHAAGWGRYPPFDGTADLRQAICAWLTRRHALPDGWLDPDRHALPVAGSREALFMTASVVVPTTPRIARPAVLLPNPLYQVYWAAAVVAGAEPILVPAHRDSGFQPDYTALPRDVLARTVLAYVNSPANPQGSVLSLDRFEQLVALAREHDFVLASDECYSEIYSGEAPPGALSACAGGDLSNVLVFQSLSKRSSVPGLRSGFIAGDPDLLQRFQRLRHYAGATVPLPIMAVSAALWSDEDHVEASRRVYRRKFDEAIEVLDGRWGAYRPGGSFFLWLDVGDGEACAKRLWAAAGVRVLPGGYLARDTAAGNPGARYIRIALVDNPDTARTAIERLAQTLSTEPA